MNLQEFKYDFEKKAISPWRAAAAGGLVGGSIAGSVQFADDKGPRKSKLRRVFGATLAGGLTGAVGGVFIRKKIRQAAREAADEFSHGGSSRGSYSYTGGSSRGSSSGSYSKGSGAGSNSYQRTSTSEDAKSFFNMGSIKTKKDAKKAMRAAAKKHHPDLGGSTEMMKKVNAHKEKIEKSAWFSKLAMRLRAVNKDNSLIVELEKTAQALRSNGR